MSDLIADWWKAFAEAAPLIDGHFTRGEEFDIVGWIDRHLGAVHPDLMWEFGPAIQQPGHRLVITPEARHELRPLVWVLLGSAPEIPGWEFYEYRLPESFERANRAVRGRTGRDLSGMSFSAERGDYRRLDVKLYFSEPVPNEELANELAFYGLEALVGEENLDRWIGAIEVCLDAPTAPTRHLEELPDAVEGFMASMDTELPDVPWHAIDPQEMKYSLLKLEPEEQEDYPRQQDLMVIGVTDVEMIQNAIAGTIFDSRRFSKCGERFCYLKIDGSSGLDFSEFADRADIEEAINEAIRPHELGSVIGGGTGLRYSYIELALTNIPAAWDQIAAALSAGRIPKRTWLLCHDADLADINYGVYDDTPPPP